MLKFAPLSMEYSSGGVPPEADMLIDPGAGIMATAIVIEANMGGGSPIVSAGNARIQDFESRTTAVYIPAGRLLKSPADAYQLKLFTQLFYSQISP